MLIITDVTRIYLGIQGENNARPIAINVHPWLIEYPSGSVSIWHRRNGDANPQPTGAVFDDEAETITWTPSSTDTYVDGEGEAEIRLTENGIIKKSKSIKTCVSPAVTGAGVTLGSDWQSYINEVERIKGLAVSAKEDAEDAAEDAEDAKDAAEDAQEAAEDAQEAAEEARDAAQDAASAIENMTVSSSTLSAGSEATVQKTVDQSGAVHLAFGIPKGAKGDAGEQGPEGPQGEPGDPTELIDDTAGSGDTDVTWSADKLARIDDDVSDLKNEIDSKPDTKSSDATNVDLDVADENGNVILRLKDGHIRTKNFDSDDMGVKPSNASNVDLDIADGDGNVIARFSGGHIKTKEFDSRELIELNEQINPFFGKKYAALGDSITYGFIPRNYEGYPGQLDSFAKLTAQKLGMTFVNKGIEGSTLAYHDSRSPMSRRYSELPDDADIVTVMGGTNDIRQGITLGQMSDRTDSTYYGALHVILGGLYKKYFIDQGTTTGKKKKIIVCTPIKLLSESAQTQGGEGTLVDMSSWVEAVKEVASYYSMPVMDFYNLSNINPHVAQTIQGTETGYTGYYNPYITDGTHPTQEGAYLMADAFIGFLKTLE